MGRSTELVNARLKLVRGEGVGDTYESVGDTYDDPPADPEDAPDPGPPKLDQDVGVFYEERRQRKLEGGVANVHVWRSLLVSSDLEVDWGAGDVLTIRRDGALEDEVVVVEAVEGTDAPKGEVAGEVILTLKTG